MRNEGGSFGQLLSKPKRRRKAIVGPTNTWLSKRRDGASKCWMVTWYDPGTRNVRYRSTRTVRLADAKKILEHFQLPENAETLAPKPRTSYDRIYFIAGDVGLIKIGLSRDPVRRLKMLQCGSPIELKILAQGFGTSKDERTLHSRFAKHRVHGEWFERHPDILAEIARLSNTEASA